MTTKRQWSPLWLCYGKKQSPVFAVVYKCKLHHRLTLKSHRLQCEVCAVQIFSVGALIYCPVKRFYESIASQDAGSDASSPQRMQAGETVGAAVTLEPLNQLKRRQQMTEWAWLSERSYCSLMSEFPVSQYAISWLMANGCFYTTCAHLFRWTGKKTGLFHVQQLLDAQHHSFPAGLPELLLFVTEGQTEPQVQLGAGVKTRGE